MSEMGKMLIGMGCVLILVGVLLVVAARLHLPLGKLPGDILYRGKNTTVYFPLATCIVVSVVLTVVLWLVGKVRK